MSGEGHFGQGWKINRIMTEHGRLAVMEHEAGIEWILGLRLHSGHGFGSGCGLGSGYRQIQHP